MGISVCDLTVPGTENFLIGSGLVVHNCKDTADAVCGAVFSAYNANKDAATPSKFERAKILASVTQDLRILRKDREVGKLNNRNFW